MTRSYIVSLLNRESSGSSRSSSRTGRDRNSGVQIHHGQPLAAAAAAAFAERHEIFDHPAMATAAKSCVFIKRLALTLCFPARTISTAQLLVHRAYIFQANNSISTVDLATACLFVAAKMEETIKKLRDILAHSYVISSSQPRGDPQSVSAAVIDKMRPGVLMAEQFVLNAIGFDFRTAHPHLLYVKLAKLAGVSRATAAAGWHVLADSYYTTLPIQYPSVVIAAGSLCLAWNLNCSSPQDINRFFRAAFGIIEGDAAFLGRAERLDHRRGNSVSSDLHPAQASKPPAKIKMTEDWWIDFGISTDDMQSFVRQIADFYLLFFNSAVASAEFIEKNKAGLPSSEMSRRIGQWRMWLQNSSTTPVSPKT
ncbi:RNA polymerase II C-terminal domain kinase beta subunit [Coemansia sp. RSA 2599]|nr:RNA polymerase II C-terminal domain kinase beta subunit [Coemansia sp. RSA 2598]KAJ1826914.1 RNA polymerase II C-terminal domain kinase beta subunit [Coemansia sp. RSA 2599]